MLSPLTIVQHLQKYLSKLTTDFSIELSVSGEIVDGDPQILRLTTATSHGKIAGQKIIINDALINNPIVDIAFYDTDNVIRFTTLYNHDLTEYYNNNLFDGKIRLSGFVNDDLNADFNFVSVPSQKMFEIQYDYDTHFALEGTEILTENVEIGLNNIWTIESVTDITIDILLTGLRQFNPGVLSQIKSVVNLKMDVVIDEASARALYKSGNHLFVIMEKGSSAKNREINSDANALNAVGDEQRQSIINEFSINLFIQTTNDFAGSNAINKCWTTYLLYLFYCLQGKSFETFENSDYLTSFLNHGSVFFNKAYYEHSYTFQYVYDITYQESFLKRFIESVPFKEIDLSFHEKEIGSKIILNEEV